MLFTDTADPAIVHRPRSASPTNELVQRLSPPPAVLAIATQLERAGFETWCVGGAIRDALLGHPHSDWDLATSATPAEMRELFGARRTIPIGVEFGTVGVLDREGKMHEVTTFRRDVKTDGRHAEVEFGVSLDDDLARRDFTINAIAYSPARAEIRDPFGGRADLDGKVIRAVGDPDARMREDRLRALRAIRFAARFGFTIDRATRLAIESSAPHLGRLSRERVKQELDKTMEQVSCPSVALAMWQLTGAFQTLLPQVARLSPEALSVPDYLGVPGPERRPARRALRFAGLFASLSPREAVSALESLRASRAEIQLVGSLVERWQQLGTAMRDVLMGGAPDDTHVRQWVAAIGRLEVAPFMRLASACWNAARIRGSAAPPPEAIRQVYRRMLRSAFRDPIDLGALAVDGDDLRRAGIPAGPRLGKILRTLLDMVIADPTKNTADYLLHEAQRQHEQALGEASQPDHPDRRMSQET